MTSGGIEGVLMLNKKQYNIFKYVFGAMRQLFRFSIISQTSFLFESNISFVYSFNIMFKLSK